MLRQKPTEYVESTLIQKIVDSSYMPNSNLPSERDLAIEMGVTRPTIREALQRLSRDGWLTIQHGKATRINNIWREGGLNILSGLIKCSEHLPEDFIPNVLRVRLDLAPSYAQAAVENNPQMIEIFLRNWHDLADTPQAFASYDWALHHILTVASENPIYTLILNGFSGFYEAMARVYFQQEDAREASRAFYEGLYVAARTGDAQRAHTITLAVISASLRFWSHVSTNDLMLMNQESR